MRSRFPLIDHKYFKHFHEIKYLFQIPLRHVSRIRKILAGPQPKVRNQYYWTKLIKKILSSLPNISEMRRKYSNVSEIAKICSGCWKIGCTRVSTWVDGLDQTQRCNMMVKKYCCHNIFEVTLTILFITIYFIKTGQLDVMARIDNRETELRWEKKIED